MSQAPLDQPQPINDLNENNIQGSGEIDAQIPPNEVNPQTKNDFQNNSNRIITDAVTPNSEEMTLFWEHITLKTPIKNYAKSQYARSKVNHPNIEISGNVPMKTVVNDLTGIARPGELVGLLGPSGCGKTVLLDIISDRLQLQSGSTLKKNVYVNNNKPLTRELFGKRCAYVMQDDVLLDTLTPLECMQFSANLRLSCSQTEKNMAAEKVIEDLRLQTCKNTRVTIIFNTRLEMY